ncbi:MAG: HAD family phosphatase [Sphaerochaetaceae bacterium]
MKGIIFDMDGVLIDSEPQQFEVNIKTLRMFGVDVKYDELHAFMGMDNLEIFKIFQKKYNLKVSAERLLQIKTDMIIEEMRNHLHIMPKFEEMKKALKSIANVKYAIASSSPRISVDIVIKQLKWENFLSASVTGDEVSTSKPSPEIYHKAASLLGVDEKDCLVLEDSTNGIQSALDAGMKVVGFLSPNSENQDLSKVRYKISSLDEFVSYVNKFVSGENMNLS